MSVGVASFSEGQRIPSQGSVLVWREQPGGCEHCRKNWFRFARLVQLFVTDQVRAVKLGVGARSVPETYPVWHYNRLWHPHIIAQLLAPNPQPPLVSRRRHRRNSYHSILSLTNIEEADSANQHKAVTLRRRGSL